MRIHPFPSPFVYQRTLQLIIVIYRTFFSLSIIRYRYILFFPLIYLSTPSTSSVVESILFALSAPVQYGPREDPLAAPVSSGSGGEGTENEKPKAVVDDRGKTVGGGEIVRDCWVVE